MREALLARPRGTARDEALKLQEPCQLRLGPAAGDCPPAQPPVETTLPGSDSKRLLLLRAPSTFAATVCFVAGTVYLLEQRRDALRTARIRDSSSEPLDLPADSGRGARWTGDRCHCFTTAWRAPERWHGRRPSGGWPGASAPRSGTAHRRRPAPDAGRSGGQGGPDQHLGNLVRPVPQRIPTSEGAGRALSREA